VLHVRGHVTIVRPVCTSQGHGRKSWELGTSATQNLEWGTQIVPQIWPFFKIFSTRLLALKCSKNVYQPNDADKVFTTSQKYVSKVQQITNSGENFSTFLAMARTKISLGTHAISCEHYLFFNLGKRLARTLPWWGWLSLPTPSFAPQILLPPSLLDLPLRPQNSSQICNTAQGRTWPESSGTRNIQIRPSRVSQSRWQSSNVVNVYPTDVVSYLSLGEGCVMWTH